MIKLTVVYSVEKGAKPLRDIDYATAVARVRVNENSLLSTSDIDRLCGTKSEQEAIAVLQEKGFLSAGENVETALESVVSKAFSLIKEIAPDKNEFDFLLIKNQGIGSNGQQKSFLMGFVCVGIIGCDKSAKSTL